MSDYEGLLNAVLEQPDDDLPRLVMADWFTENGMPERGEFIRVQIELKSLPICDHARRFEYDPDCRWCYLNRTEEWYTHNPEEGREPPPWQPTCWLKVGESQPLEIYAYWDRGFVGRINFAGLIPFQFLGELLAEHPITSADDGVYTVSIEAPKREGVQWTAWLTSPDLTVSTGWRTRAGLVEGILPWVEEQLG